MNQFWSNLVTMTSDLARRCPMTLDPVKGHSRSQGSNFIFFFKMYLLLQTTCDINMSWSYDLTSVRVYGVYTDLRSKVIKGSFPVRIQKSSKCIFFYKQHVILTWVGHMTWHQSVSMGCTQIWGQRSLRGHFWSESKNLQNVSSFTNNMWYWHELVIWLDISRCLWGVHRLGVIGH